MSGDSGVTEEQCEGRITRVYDQLNGINSNLSRVLGGIIVLAFMFSIISAGVAYHMRYRFSVVEDSLKNIDKKLHKTYPEVVEECPITPVTLTLR